MTTQNETRVTIRVDRDLKERAENLFRRMGLNMSTALNIFLRKAVDESAIPFQVCVKPNDSRHMLSTDETTDLFKTAVHDDIEKNME